jgi:hypothetical protein
MGCVMMVKEEVNVSLCEQMEHGTTKNSTFCNKNYLERYMLSMLNKYYGKQN